MIVGRRSLPGWLSLFVRRKESLQTTWTLRILVVAVSIALAVGTKGFWTPRLAASLTCAEDIAPSDALLLENFDPEYLVFERASALVASGVGRRVFVPVPVEGDLARRMPNRVSAGLAELMARIARLPAIELVPITQEEPITLNVAHQLREHLTREGVRTLTVVSPSFRSRRSMLIYSTAFAPDINVRCVPVHGLTTATNWADTWHGIQDVGLQFVKLQYYRYWIFAS
jgi:hypothetical protein